VAATIWLKPFDLGVCQELRIALQSDPETGEYIARVTLRRLSGTRTSWLRLNRAFVRLVRRQFLHWRAVRPEQRGEMFEEGRTLLRAQVLGREAANV
jgi:acyl-CoA reductase-like NAD-dependent aldehyde dehydrogenase